MGTITDLMCQKIGPFEDRNVLRRAYIKLDEKVNDLIRVRGVPRDPQKQLALIQEARHTINTLLPQDGLAIALHELNEAVSLSQEDVRREAIKEAIRSLYCWKNIMDQQIQGGHKMPLTQIFWTQCEKRLSQIDPDHKIRDEIDQEGFWPQMKTLGISLIGTGTMLIVTNKIINVSSKVMTQYLGATVTSAFGLTFQGIGLFNLIRTFKKNPILNTAFIGLTCYFLYGKLYSIYAETLATSS